MLQDEAGWQVRKITKSVYTVQHSVVFHIISLSDPFFLSENTGQLNIDISTIIADYQKHKPLHRQCIIDNRKMRTQ